MLSVIRQNLNGISQIMLQENWQTGFLFLLGIFYGSLWMGLAACFAVMVSTVTAKLLHYKQEAIDQGLYGFNAALVGVALFAFLQPSLLSWMLALGGAVISTILHHFFMKKAWNTFTLSFVLVTWCILFVIQKVSPYMMVSVSAPEMKAQEMFFFAFKGYGQVIFQDSLTSGLLFFMAVFVCSPIHALFGFAGGVLSVLVLQPFALPISDIALGLFSYNAVLCAIVFAGVHVRDGLWAFSAVCLAASISLLMHTYHVLPLTFPFVASSFLVLTLRNILKSNKAS